MNHTIRFNLIISIQFLLISIAYSQSENINLQAQWNEAQENYNDVWGYADDKGNEYAIIGSKTKVHFLDVSEPTSPKLLDNFALGSNTSWRDMKTYKHYAYAVSEGTSNEGLAIFDLCNISEGIIQKVYQKSDVFGRAHNIFIDVKNAKLYVVGTNTRKNGMIVYDLSSDPTNPTLVGNTNLAGGYIHDVFVKDNIAFCSHGNNGLYIYDYSNPATPIYKSSITTNGYNHSSWAFEDRELLIFAEELPAGLPLGIINYDNYQNNDIEVIKTFKAPLLSPSNENNTAHNPYMLGDLVFVSYYEDGVVVFDLSDPLNPQRIAYYDTNPNNLNYSGTKDCWGVYPFLPSGNILASDISRGLFILKPTFNLDTNCNNGQQDWNEKGIDCGGVCELCEPCLQEICGNGLDDDRNGLVDCLDAACDCPGSETVIQVKVCLEGFIEDGSNLMSAELVSKGILPQYQPFKLKPYYYKGIEKIENIADNIIDWLLLEARDPNKLDSVLARKAVLLLADGRVMQADSLMGVQFGDISSESIRLVVRQKGHLAVMSSQVIDLTASTEVFYDFTTNENQANGNQQLKKIGEKYALFSGDFDQNGIINNLDFNIWKQNNALIDKYVTWDVDGNGVVNNLDFNNWAINRSKVGEPFIQF